MYLLFTDDNYNLAGYITSCITIVWRGEYFTNNSSGPLKFTKAADSEELSVYSITISNTLKHT
jgi:hypothetical protein